MRRLRQFLVKLMALTRRVRSERSLDREMSTHLEMLEEDFRRRGIGPEEARAAARRAFGAMEQAKEQYRDQRGFVGMEQFWQDLWHAARGLRHSAGFSLVAVFSLALGIGVNTAIFTLLNGVLLKRLPIPEADRVVQLQALGKDWSSNGLSYPVVDGIRRQSAIFPELTAFSFRRAVLDRGGNPEQVELELVTGNYFDFFHGAPALGRLLTDDDDRVEGAHAVCVLSYAAWRSRFGGDPRVLGRVVRIDRFPFEIVGVARPDFVGAELQNRYDVWVPTAMAEPITWNARSNAHVLWLRALAKLRPGATVAESRARLKAAIPGINEALPPERAASDATFDFVDGSRGNDNFRTRLHSPLMILMTGVGLVLLIACANLTNLLLARGNDRTQEFSVKLSLGISRSRLMRQLLMESSLLSLAGGVAAVFAARGLVDVLLGLFNAGNDENLLQVSIDPAVLAFTLAVCAFITLVAGVYPAWTATLTDIAPALKGVRGTGIQKRLIRRSMIVAQISLAVVLLFGASIFANSLRKLKTVDLGFDIEHVAVIDVNYRGHEQEPGVQELRGVLGRIRRMPGVEAADLANPSMLSGASMESAVEARNGLAAGGTRKVENAYFVLASPGHFATLRMPVLRGRDFLDKDRKGSQSVAIVNRRLAQMLWPGQDALGKHMFGGWNGENPIVIGVVGNSKYENARDEMKPIVYEPIEQLAVTGASLEVRSNLSVAELERQVRKMVDTETLHFQVANVATMELLRDNGIAQDRLLTFLSVLFGLLGTTLALVGIYGLISYSVGRRTREIGIRVSVGAQRHEILLMFMSEVLMLVGAGVAIGLPLAIVVSNPLKAFLYEVSPADPAGMGATLVLIVVGSLAASFWPARRATKVDPAVALRWE